MPTEAPYDPLACSHVAPKMREYLAIDGRGRIDACWERIWVRTELTDKAFAALTDCLNAGNSTKPRGLMIVGEADTGKSRVLKAFRDAHPVECKAESEYASHPVVLINAPTKISRSAVLHAILQDLGEPILYKADEELLSRHTIRALQRCQVRIVMIDEFHDVTHGSLTAQIVSFLAFVKNLINGVGRPFVVCGLPRLRNVIATDPQMVGRLGSEIYLKRFTETQFLRALLTFELLLPLRLPSNLRDEPKIMQRIYARSQGYIGLLSILLQDACRTAIESGVEKITLKVLDDTPEPVIRSVGRQEA